MFKPWVALTWIGGSDWGSWWLSCKVLVFGFSRFASVEKSRKRELKRWWRYPCHIVPCTSPKEPRKPSRKKGTLNLQVWYSLLHPSHLANIPEAQDPCPTKMLQIVSIRFWSRWCFVVKETWCHRHHLPPFRSNFQPNHYQELPPLVNGTITIGMCVVLHLFSQLNVSRFKKSLFNVVDISSILYHGW